MASLIEKENELRKLAESGEYEDIIELADFLYWQKRYDEAEEYYRKLAEIDEYWGVHLLGDFLYDQKRYDEAKEEYLKIAGPDDLSGDANSHLFQMLLDMGEYEESLKYYGYIKNRCDTSPAEGAYFRLVQELRNPESKLFMYIDEESFYYNCLPLICDMRLDKLSRFVDGDEDNEETGEQYLKENIETILLTRTKSEDEKIKQSAKMDLLWLYLAGMFRVGDFEMASFSGKNLQKAIALLPSHFSSIYSDKQEEMEYIFIQRMQTMGYDLDKYIADYELEEFVRAMEKVGCAQEEINHFAESYINEMMSYEKVVASSMNLRLFGKPYTSVNVDIPSAKNFDVAVAFIPEYINFYTTDYEKHYLSEGIACLDEKLHDIIQRMRVEGYSEEEQLRFAYAWFNGIESQGKISLSLMAVYLSGRFNYKGYPNTTDILLPKLKSFEMALAVIPKYIEYSLNYYNAFWDDGVGINPKRLLENYIIPTMQESGYEDEKIELFRSKFLEEVERLGIYEDEDNINENVNNSKNSGNFSF